MLVQCLIVILPYLSRNERYAMRIGGPEFALSDRKHTFAEALKKGFQAVLRRLDLGMVRLNATNPDGAVLMNVFFRCGAGCEE